MNSSDTTSSSTIEFEKKKYRQEWIQTWVHISTILVTILGFFVLRGSIDAQTQQTKAIMNQTKEMQEQADSSAKQLTELRKQTEMNEKLVTASIHSSLMDQCQMLSDNIRSRPAVTPYLKEGKTLTAADDEELFWLVQLACEDTLDVFDTVLDLKNTLPKIFPKDPGWEAWMIDSFASSPMLCDYFMENKWWLEEIENGQVVVNQQLKELVDQGIAKREAKKQNVSAR